jgi:hypothetical protein
MAGFYSARAQVKIEEKKKARPIRSSLCRGEISIAARQRLARNGLPLAIAFIALAGLRYRLGMTAAIGAERTADVVALVEPPFRIAADVAFIGSGVDELALRSASAAGCGFAPAGALALALGRA